MNVKGFVAHKQTTPYEIKFILSSSFLIAGLILWVPHSRRYLINDNQIAF